MLKMGGGKIDLPKGSRCIARNGGASRPSERAQVVTKERSVP
jgi:hypothetical protein